MNATTYTPSPEQAVYYEWIKTGTGSAILESVAGSGKTETLARGIQHMEGPVAVLMFNRDAGIEFKQRIANIGLGDRRMLFISTCHSAGLSAWNRWAGKDSYEVVEKKTANLIEEICMRSTTSPEDVGKLVEGQRFIEKLVGMGKQLLAGVKWDVHNREAWLKIVQHYSLDAELSEEADVAGTVEWAINIFLESGKRCLETEGRKGSLDYDDMIWAPLAYNCRFYTNSWVVGDEWQDANPARLELARRMVHPKYGRFVGAGDSKQAIYAFTGADSQSLKTTTAMFNCQQLGLTVSYRCPIAVVEYVRQWCPHMQPHPDAPKGLVRGVVLDKPEKDKKLRAWFESDPPPATSAILCRYNKPLVQTAFQLLKAGIACKMEGRDIGMGLIALARRWKVKTLDALEKKLETFREKEIKKARARKSETMEQSANDRVDCLMVFIQRCRDKGASHVDCVVKEIEDLFADNVSAKGVITLASGHKAKGREWPVVYWIQTVQRGKRELQPWEKEQEDNLKYVIGSRVKGTRGLPADAEVTDGILVLMSEAQAGLTK